MHGYRVLAFILFQGMINVCYLAAEEDSTSSRSAYFTTHENQRLEGHVVEQFESPSSISCSYLCLKKPWCTSTNFKLLSEKNGRGTCELNKHGNIDENTKFHEQEGVTFSLILKVTHSLLVNVKSRRNHWIFLFASSSLSLLLFSGSYVPRVKHLVWRAHWNLTVFYSIIVSLEKHMKICHRSKSAAYSSRAQ